MSSPGNPVVTERAPAVSLLSGNLQCNLRYRFINR